MAMTNRRSRMKMRGACATLLLLAASVAAAAPPPVEAFASLPSVGDVVLSPDGNHLAWVDGTTAEVQVDIFDLTSSRMLHRIAVGNDMKLRGLNWADDEILTIELSKTDKQGSRDAERFRREVFRILAIDLASGKGHVLLPGAGVVRWRTTKPKTMIMTTGATLWSVDTRTGKGPVIEEGTNYTYGWLVDPEGKCVARLDYEEEENDESIEEYRFLRKDGHGWKLIYSHKGKSDVEVYGLTPDDSAIVAVTPNADGKNIAWKIPLDGSGATPLYEDPENDVEDVMTDRYSDAPVGVWLGGPLQEMRWFDQKAQARYERVARAFKGKRVVLYGRSLDEKRVLARVDGPSSPAIFYLVDFAKNTADTVGEEYPALANVALGEVRPISYKARDGVSIPAYLTLPPGSDGKHLPTVVMPHGGPDGRDDYAFNWWAQFLATRGYAVLQPQFRGSTGFGEPFHKAGYRQWGGLMQDDVTDGVKAMIEQGVTDPRRICIVGASYGGYVALAGAAFTPDLYKCAVSVSGVSDLPAILASMRAKYGSENSSMGYWKGNIGSTFDPNVIKRSPTRAADQVHVPILLIHGVDDTVVPIAQSELMAFELEKNHKQYTFVKLPGEDHWMSHAETRLRILREIDKFLATNL